MANKKYKYKVLGADGTIVEKTHTRTEAKAIIKMYSPSYQKQMKIIKI